MLLNANYQTITDLNFGCVKKFGRFFFGGGGGGWGAAEVICRTPNAECRTPNAERRTPNAERRTPNFGQRYIV